MKSIIVSATMTVVTATVVSTSFAFTFVAPPLQQQQRRTQRRHRTRRLSMGLFDGVKEAFSAPPLERSSVDTKRETPIDRWMGWNVKPMMDDNNSNNNDKERAASNEAADADFVDSMSEVNYVSITLEKPMGIIFEENDAKYQGIFVLSLKEGGRAETSGVDIKPGDQLVAVNDKKVAGISFDDALGAIVDSTDDETMLLFFRGNAKQLYGPAGASKAWMEEFIASTFRNKVGEDDSNSLKF